MRRNSVVSAILIASFVVFATATGGAQAVAKRATKKAAKEATESAAKEAVEEGAKKAAKNAMAPDPIDLNAATAESLKALGLDEDTAKKVVAGQPYASLDDPKLKEAIPADTLTKLKGKITVKAPAAPATPAPATPESATPPQ